MNHHSFGVPHEVLLFKNIKGLLKNIIEKSLTGMNYRPEVPRLENKL